METACNPESGTIAYAYDAHGNVASIVSGNVNGTAVSYSWDGLNRLATVADNRLGGATTSYVYDQGGTLGSMTYPNGVQHGFEYDALYRLRKLPVPGAGPLDQYDYTVGPAGHRLTALRLGGRTCTYTYDDTYKLVREAISGDQVLVNNGLLSYGYDRVGNRLSLASTLGAIGSRSYAYDANDRLSGDTYDNNGNTLTSGGVNYLYDFEDRLLAANGATFLYDGDENRVAKTVAGNVTRYLVDELNPTGYSQVVEELSVAGSTNVVQRTFSYGTQRISQNWPVPAMVVNYYGYDGHGSVRTLTDSAGAVTDRYEYDAFGSLVASSASAANQMLYAGEQLDPTVGMYYLRARWYRAGTGRLPTADTFEGFPEEPLSRHQYIYAHADPVTNVDPSGLVRNVHITAQPVLRAQTRLPTLYRFKDLQAVKDMPMCTIFNVPKWERAKNVRWIKTFIRNKELVFMASPLEFELLYNVTRKGTIEPAIIFAEVTMLLLAGYAPTPCGRWLVPPR